MASRGRGRACCETDCDATVPLLRTTCQRCGARQRWPELEALACPACEGAEDGDSGGAGGSGYGVDSASGAGDDVRGCDCQAVDGEWTPIVRAVLDRAPHVELAVAKDGIPAPDESGFARARGKPVGQSADYRLPLRDGGCVHVREYADRYEVHRDRIAPSASRLGHLLVDMPFETVAVGAFLALALVRGRSPAGAIARRTALSLPIVRSRR